MPTEYIISDLMVAGVTIDAPPQRTTKRGAESKFRSLCEKLPTMCSPKQDVEFFESRAYDPFYANNLDPEAGCSWTDTTDGGGSGQIVLSRGDQPRIRARVKVKLAVAEDDRQAWLTVEYNPTSLAVGDNAHPVAFVDPETGSMHQWPSSHWAALTRSFRLGFEFPEAMDEDGPLIDAETKAAIERGDIHLVRTQWAAAKPVVRRAEFLQGMSVIYGQTIARGQGIVDNAEHLGLKLTRFPHRLIKAAGAELRYLPPYSPDMNPIEKAYSNRPSLILARVFRGRGNCYRHVYYAEIGEPVAKPQRRA